MVIAHEQLTETAEEILRQRAEALAQDEAPEDIGERTAVLVFRLGEEWYGARVADVREILQDFVITPLPCVPAYVLGVVSVRGEVLSVTDPARLMGLGAVSAAHGAGPSAVVIGDGTVATALAVDEVGDIVEVSPDDTRSPVSISDSTLVEFVAATMSSGDRMFGLINVDRMLQPVVSAPGQ